ncbi:MAG: hypothetical protein A2750_01760 [Candidatus Yanofskybacteria bacterium RIFCSPHIGHO2_01_FULL_45_42]|uniref:Uncharacterized protein n=1 Tax=Candidatus Yanofskybacteria bacterium RIFCSPHIGHO2_01_FULL_45_42 TaxID=1802671 RepID=A0A1F8F0Y3_9BACT|nr:MAG: hypothetical protein A2750_01760 [Candidatus Yanofskybacteria bacterium RIFCSPHIGHO2_01_FULL_45_42]
MVAEPRHGRGEALTFPTWCRILELVRTAFAAYGGEEVPPRESGKAAEPHESKPQKNPLKTSARTIFCRSRKEKF